MLKAPLDVAVSPVKLAKVSEKHFEGSFSSPSRKGIEMVWRFCETLWGWQYFFVQQIRAKLSC